ncbi:MAG: hypothetical protein LBL46_02820 [Rickettsiales bacterium]|jgi:hypothetical protein|nr:hypothetical protein [Rickettsiales bacterium]
MKITAEQFFDLERRIIESGADADLDSFATIRERLKSRAPVDADEFARQACYVVLAGGFSQKTAKKIHSQIMEILNTSRHPGAGRGPLHDNKLDADDMAVDPGLRRDDARYNDGDLYETLFSIFHNKNKINAIMKLWSGRQNYRDIYYALPGQGERLKYLANLPHIGKITANHLARNLGENMVKYDIWIQRLAVADTPLAARIDNGDLDPAVKSACDEMFADIERSTGLPRGYIDVVLWKACQTGLLLKE